MNIRVLTIILLSLLCLGVSSAHAEIRTPAPGEGTLVTLWPLVDYREIPKKNASRLSLLGPLLTFDRKDVDSSIAIRPLLYRENNSKNETSSANYLYPLASSEEAPDTSRFEILHLLQSDTFRKNEPAAAESRFMLFPFIISGESKKYGPYTSVFPLYGDIYERYWKDEYHYVLFPLYSRTVKNNTTNYNLLYPFFTFTTGENESGFQFWPLYGHTAKDGVYSSTFAFWPIYLHEQRGLNTDTPSTRFNLFPLYGSFESPRISSTTWLWPFFGHSIDNQAKEEEWDFFWPFWLTVRGEKHTITKFLPFYAEENSPDASKNWYLWPLYRTDSFQSSAYRQERQRLLYFLFSDRLESWAVDDKSRRRTALWPLFVYSRDTDDTMGVTMPALVEPILDRDGIEKNWAPLWRLYSHQWNNGTGESSLSLLWNLYWYEQSRDTLAWEMFPLFRYRSAPRASEVQFLKGLINYRNNDGESSLSLFWLPIDFTLGEKSSSQTTGESKP
jgi:hypothetical protein